MSRDFYLAPFFAQHTFLIDQERTADNAHELAAIHRLFVNYIKQPAQRFIAIGQQVEGKFLFGAKILVAADAVPGNPQDLAVQFPIRAEVVPKILALACTARSTIFGVKIYNQVLSGKILQGK